MTPEQLLLFTVLVALWIVLSLGIIPWLPGRALRREVAAIGLLVLAVLLVVSLLTAPSLLLWLKYMAVTLVILLLLFAYNHWFAHVAE